MRSPHRLVLCLVAAGLAGCVPWPHHYLTAPRISGTVSAGGRPMAGVHVQLADLMQASGEVAAAATRLDTVTDAQGHFALGPIRRFAWSAHVPVLTVSQNAVPWGLRLSPDGHSWRAGWLSDPTLFGYVMKQPLSATCNLDAASRSSVIEGDKSLVGNGSCTLTAVESKQ